MRATKHDKLTSLVDGCLGLGALLTYPLLLVLVLFVELWPLWLTALLVRSLNR